jgi:hypothetical protein
MDLYYLKGKVIVIIHESIEDGIIREFAKAFAEA